MATQIVVTDLRQAFEQARDLDGSMNERLDVFAGAVRRLHPAIAAIVDRLVDRLQASTAPARPRRSPATTMPPFVLPDENGRLVSLKDLLGAGPGRRDLPPRPLVPVLPHQHQHAGQGAAAHRGARRPHGGDRAGPPAVRGRNEERFQA